MNEGKDDLINDNKNENSYEKEQIDYKKEDETKESKIEINSMKVEELKNELKKRSIEIPKNAKKKDLQELLMNSNRTLLVSFLNYK